MEWVKWVGIGFACLLTLLAVTGYLYRIQLPNRDNRCRIFGGKSIVTDDSRYFVLGFTGMLVVKCALGLYGEFVNNKVSTNAWWLATIPLIVGFILQYRHSRRNQNLPQQDQRCLG